MHFIEIFSLLPNKSQDIKRFGDFIESRYHNPHPQVVRLYQHLCHTLFKLPNFEEVLEDKKWEHHLQQVTKELSIGYTVLGVYYTYLKKLLESYLIWEYQVNFEEWKHRNLLKVLENHSQFKGKTSEWINKLEKEVDTKLEYTYSVNDLYANFELQEIQYNHLLTFGSTRESKEKFLSLLVPLKQYIIILYLQYGLEVINKERIHRTTDFSQQFPLKLLRYILHLIEQQPSHLDNPLVALYYHLAACLWNEMQHDKEKELAHYTQLKLSLQRSIKQLKDKSDTDRADAINIFYATLNYVRRKENYVEYTLLMRYAEKHSFFYTKAGMPPLLYLNTLKGATKAADSFRERERIAVDANSKRRFGTLGQRVEEEIQRYIQNNSPKLPAVSRNFVNAIVYGWCHSYQLSVQGLPPITAVMRDLRQEVKMNLAVRFDRRVLLLQLCYLSDDDHWEIEKNNFGNFIDKHQQELSVERKAMYYHFITFISNLFKLREAITLKQTQSIKRIRRRIQNDFYPTTYLAIEKEWLMYQYSLL